MAAEKLRFTPPYRTMVAMTVALGLFALLIAALIPILTSVFLASPYLNGLIIGVFFVGVGATFWQILQLTRSVNWIKAYNANRHGDVRGTPRLLAPLVVMMRGNRLPTGMATASAQSILDSVATRLDEIRDITRYIINVLIFLGLLGTFYGLAVTIPAVVDTVRSLRVGGGDSTAMVNELFVGLERQLGGMSTAFGSSLIGLAGSLMVGLLDLLAGHGQNRFYREFEEWLSNFTAVGMADQIGGAEISGNADSPLARALVSLGTSISRLDARLNEQFAGNRRVEELFEQITELMKNQENMSADTRNTLRSVETQLVRLSEDLTIGRDRSTQELRNDLLAINQTLLRAIAE